MDISLFLRGLALGFSIAAPVGPIGVLCIRRALANGPLSGFLSGLGAATADALYGCVAAFGLTFISNLLVTQQFWLRLLGGLFLLYLGARTFIAKPSDPGEARIQSETSGKAALGDYLSTLALTLTNPMTILSFAAVFAGLGLGGQSALGYSGAAWMVAGVFLGSAAWWLLLSGGVGLLRARFNRRWMGWINKASGMVIIAFGLLALGSIIQLIN